MKHIIDLIHDYNVLGVVGGREPRRQNEKCDPKLLTLALLILFMTFGIEAGVLFLTNPTVREVTNTLVTFRIRQPIPPNWDGVRFHNRASLNRPCGSLALEGVEQGRTRITPCTTRSLAESSAGLFITAAGEVDLKIVSDFHDYGAEHAVIIGNLTSSISSIVYFSLGDGKPRVMKRAPNPKHEKE